MLKVQSSLRDSLHFRIYPRARASVPVPRTAFEFARLTLTVFYMVNHLRVLMTQSLCDLFAKTFRVVSLCELPL